MNALGLLRELKARGVELTADGERLRYRAPQGALTPELANEVRAHKRELLAALAPPDAVRLVNTVVGAVWVVADAAALAANADILASGLPVFYADELAALAGHTADELRAVAATKRQFPGSRIVQDAAAGTGERYAA